MRHTIDHGPAFTTLTFACQEGESVLAQPGVMLGMTTGFAVEARMGSQMPGAIVRLAPCAVPSGENFFTSVYTAKRDGGDHHLARPILVRSAASRPLMPRRLCRHRAFIACTAEVKFELSTSGAR
jgi:uncharacterized protein (AIM24 family)